MNRDEIEAIVTRVLFGHYDVGEYASFDDDLASITDQSEMSRRIGARAQAELEARDVVDALVAAGCVPSDALTRAALRCDICGEPAVGDDRFILCAECATPEPPPTNEACPECHGIGRDENAHFWCSTCRGTGSIPLARGVSATPEATT